MANSRPRNLILMASCMLTALLLSACAHSAGSYDPVSPIKNEIILSNYANLSLVANNDNIVPMTAYDRERLINTIVRKLQAANRFKTIDVASSESNTLVATIQITNYDRGNAFLRFLLAGLGQIHIDGKLTLVGRDTGEQVGHYDVSKTFAWGGLYGLGTTIEQVEEGFAEAVVEILLQKDRKPEDT